MVNYGIGELYQTTISAAGTTQATATLLTAPINNVTTVAANSGVILPFVSPGYEVCVYNSGANALTVYPSTTSKLNSLATNAGAVLGTNSYANYTFAGVVSGVGQWFVNLSA